MASAQVSPSKYSSEGTHVRLTPESKGVDYKRYNLTNTEIRAVDNGFVISCRYKVKPEFEKNGKKELDYDMRYQSEEHVCQSREEAAEFVASRILGKEYRSATPAAKSKVSVKKV